MIKDPPLLKIRRLRRVIQNDSLESIHHIPLGFLVDAMDGRGAMEHRIRLLEGFPKESRLLGTALTCHCGPGDNLGLFGAVAEAQPGDLIVAATDSFEGTCLSGDLLMGMAFYGHFRTEHVHVHHRFVGTKKDAVTARYNESFYTFFLRVIPECLKSAWKVETSRLLGKNKSIFDFSNPFYVYLTLALFFLLLSFFIGGFQLDSIHRLDEVLLLWFVFEYILDSRIILISLVTYY